MEALYLELEALIPTLSIILVILVELLKPFDIKSEFIPHVSILLGAAVGAVIAFATGESYVTYGLAGAIAGATASGIYDTGKGTVNAIEKRGDKR